MAQVQPLSSAPLEDDSDPTYTHFAHRAEFLALLERFLSLNLNRDSDDKQDQEEEGIVASLGAILDYYLPLPGLLDPSLDEIVPPLMEALGQTLHTLLEDGSSSSTFVNPKRLARLGQVLNWVVKVRGWKAVVPHFPSTIPNLPMLVTLLSPPSTPSTSTTPSTPHHPLISTPETWELRAVLLLWLALLLTVPFDLTALSDSSIAGVSTIYGIDQPSAAKLFNVPMAELAQRVVLLSIPFLTRPGQGGAFSALVLARLYSREDAIQGLEGFFDWAAAEISEGEREGEANLIASIFNLLALLPSLVKTGHLSPVERYIEDRLLPHLRGSRTAAGSGLIRKLAVKAKGRLWLAKLGKGWKGHAAEGLEEEDMELPEGLEEVLDDLMGGLSDKDTIVRYSSAKYIARLSALLPPSFTTQIVQATIALFAGTEEEPVTLTSFGAVIDPGGSSTTGGTMGFGGLESTRGEARWHGVCLALAEMARRGLVSEEVVEEAVEWVVKALSFDLRRASHSIGANVRDAAAYLLWSLSRACPPKVLEAYAETMATALVCVAVFDREVGVRRAASAAFQEGVGRLGLYPEGIDVLAKTDFYSVSVRRIAFTVAAPAVSVHKVYRDKMRAHLHNITLRHWDAAMRSQGAQALKSLLEAGEEVDMQDSVDREIKELPSLDAANVHGALLALGYVASLFEKGDRRCQFIFDALSTIRPAAFVSSQAADIVSSICDLLVVILNPTILASSTCQPVIDKFVDMAMKRREPEVHESLAKVYCKTSGLRNPEKDINKLISDLKTFRVAQRQAACLCLGHILYPLCSSSPVSEKAVRALLGVSGDTAKMDIESRRYAARSLGDIAVQRVDAQPVVSSDLLLVVLHALLKGLDDYMTDQRGDVGSWVRATSLNSLGRVLSTTEPSSSSAAQTSTSPAPTAVVDQALFHQIIGGIVKQAVEKLESVRGQSALALASMRQQGWIWEGDQALQADLGLLRDEGFRYIDQTEWFGSAMSLLETRYRPDLLAGLVHSVGSQVLTLSQSAFTPFLAHIKSHPTLVQSILQDLLSLLEMNYTSNRILIPTLQTVHKLLSNNVLGEQPISDQIREICCKITAIACKGLGSIKSIERITASMRIVIASLTSADESIRAKAIESLPIFLGHRFPRIRAISSEEIYLSLSNQDDEIDEELEEVLVATDWVGQEYKEEVVKVVDLLSNA